MCSLASISQRENPNAIFASDKIGNLDDLVDAVANMTTNDAGYELNISTTSDTQVEFASNLDKITHISNGDTH